MSEWTDADVEPICVAFHDAYEAAAAEAGWETQERSRKPWADVPEANKATMRATVRALLASGVVVPARVVEEARAEVADAFVAWAAKNEIAEPPLDWAWFGEITRRYSSLHAEFGRE